MGPSKKEDTKQLEISLNKNLKNYERKSLDNSFQTVEDVSENKKKMQDDYLERPLVKENLESAVETADKHAEVSERKKKRKSKRSNLLEKNDVEQNLVADCMEKAESKSFSTSVQNTKTISGFTDKSNPEIWVDVNLGTLCQTADSTFEGYVVDKRLKRKKKKRNEYKHNDPDENLLVTRTLCGPEVTNTKHLEKEDSSNKRSHEVLTCNDMIAVDPSTFSKSETNSMTKNDSSTNLVSVEESFLMTYQRKKKKLFHSLGNHLSPSKEEAPISSLNVQQNSSKEGDMLTLMKSKKGVKSSNVSYEGSSNVAEKVTTEIGSLGEKNSEKCHNNSENEHATGKTKRAKVEKVKETINGDEFLTERSICNISNQHFSVEENKERSKNDCKKDKSLFSFESGDTKHVPADSVELCNNNGCSTSSPAVENVATGESSISFSNKKVTSKRRIKVKGKHTLDERKASDTSPMHHTTKQPEHNVLSEYKMEEMISLSLTRSDIKDVLIEKMDNPSRMSTEEGCSSLLPAIEDVSLGKKYANLVSASSRWRRRYKRRIAKHTANEDAASEIPSVWDLPTEQLEPRDECCIFGDENLVMEESLLLDGKNLEVEAFHLGEGNLDLSSNACQMEERTSLNEDITRDAVVVGITNEQDNPVRTLPASPVAPINCMRRKLLVLDLNGLLADIVSDAPRGYKADKYISQKALFKRPFCDDFLKFCFENFNVGVWSSRTKKNVNSVVDFLMGDMQQKLLFSWHQSHCTGTGFSTLENKQKPLVLKELRKLWDKCEDSLPWEKGAYNESNTLLLDDSPYKALRNPPHTAIFPPPYGFKDKDDNSLGPGGDLRVYLEGLVKAENVQKYVEQHPFGQRAITSTSPSWAFYLRIIGNNDARIENGINSSFNHLQMSTA